MQRGRASRYCDGRHPALPVGGRRVIYGGSCLAPLVLDAALYVGLDAGMAAPAPGEAILFAIRDAAAPADLEPFRDLIVEVSARLDRGHKIHVGCIAGHGRTGTFLSALVAHRRASADPIGYVRQHYCAKAVETAEQVDFLVRHFGCKPARPSFDLRD